MRLVAAGSSVCGPAHELANEPNQDAIGLRGCRGGWIAAACDGLGSASHGREGSKAAARACLRVLSQQGDSTDPTVAIRASWLQSIRPLQSDAAATTCLWAHIDRYGHCNAGQLGDGLMLIRSNGALRQVTPHREWFGNLTHALNASVNGQQWHRMTASLDAPGDGVVLMTDGVADDIEPAMLEGFFSALYEGARSRGRRRGRQWLSRELASWATPLHGDDKSIVMVFRTA